MKGHVFNFRKRRKEYKNIRKLADRNGEYSIEKPEKKAEHYEDPKASDAGFQRRTEKHGVLKIPGSAGEAFDFAKRNFLYLFFGGVLLIGIIWGSAIAKSADKTLTLSLDFLFTTNLQARLEHGFFEIFCACLASNFIFLAAVFVFGVSPWGCTVVPLITFFKGFGIGLCAGYLYISFGLKGLVFYLLVLLPGIFIFSIALTLQSKRSFLLSKKFFKLCFLKKAEVQSFSAQVKDFCLRSGQILIFSAFAALIDTVLWSILTPAFNFV